MPFLLKNMVFWFAGDQKQGFETTRLAQQNASLLKISMYLRLVTACTAGYSPNHHFSKVFRFLSTFGCVSPIEHWSLQKIQCRFGRGCFQSWSSKKVAFFDPKTRTDCILEDLGCFLRFRVTLFKAKIHFGDQNDDSRKIIFFLKMCEIYFPVDTWRFNWFYLQFFSLRKKLFCHYFHRKMSVDLPFQHQISKAKRKTMFLLQYFDENL